MTRSDIIALLMVIRRAALMVWRHLEKQYPELIK